MTDMRLCKYLNEIIARKWACNFDVQHSTCVVVMGFKEIGKKIQNAREERGLTQVELAQKLGITQAALSNYELGKRRFYLHQIEEIARLLNKDLEYFIGANDEAAAMRHPDESSLQDQIMSRIKIMNTDDLGALSEYLDFLKWRKNHG
jgi:transcriptional regulator with XRE-family HTH domain